MWCNGLASRNKVYRRFWWKFLECIYKLCAQYPYRPQLEQILTKIYKLLYKFWLQTSLFTRSTQRATQKRKEFFCQCQVSNVKCNYHKFPKNFTSFENNGGKLLRTDSDWHKRMEFILLFELSNFISIILPM